ncbi:glutathione binding-like protein [Nevskia soli]|uniref:glutathione binding-like protein n=1 Tax=Nevskia soli TaxID=418856 RepID=UPI0004A6C988|nr:glutathione binding-like protein [Nevskia soli]
MIDLYYWTTPNGHKITIFLEEAQLEYKLIPVNISAGQQFESSFLDISPNNRIPAIVDRHPASGENPISIFESGAILLYLAEKSGQFLPQDPRERIDVLQWVFWQVAGLGPMLGQNHHFLQYAPEKIPYAINRYTAETKRLYAVLNRRLEGRLFIANSYSIADMACYPWIVPHTRQGITLEQYPHVARWFETVSQRPAVIRAYEMATQINNAPVVSDSSREILFGQSDATVRSGEGPHNTR